jgi:DNA-binding beta-propeller fold protein YncE
VDGLTRHKWRLVAISSNAVNFVDTSTDTVKHVTCVGRSPHEVFFTSDGTEAWVVTVECRRRCRGHEGTV